jgi:hypothetical protein
MRAVGLVGVVVAGAACAQMRGGGARTAEPPRVEKVLAALDARAEACRIKSANKSPATCIAASPPVATEPILCAEYQEKATTLRFRDGVETTIARGTWRELANWELIESALVSDIPTIGEGTAVSRPLATMIPSNLDAPLPRPGHFLPAFANFERNVTRTSQDELLAVEREAATLERAIDAKLSWQPPSSARPINWSRYSRGCMEIVTGAAAVLEHDLAKATSSVHTTRERNDIASWLTASLAQCESQLNESGCVAAPVFATAQDRAACTSDCAKHIATGTERAFNASAKACAEAYAKSENESRAEKQTCTFTLPPSATTSLDARAEACAASCAIEGKKLVAESEERARAKKESAYLLYAYRSCVRASARTPEHAKARAGDAAKFEIAVALETKQCRYLSKCAWIEKFTDRVCKAD